MQWRTHVAVVRGDNCSPFSFAARHCRLVLDVGTGLIAFLSYSLTINDFFPESRYFVAPYNHKRIPNRDIECSVCRRFLIRNPYCFRRREGVILDCRHVRRQQSVFLSPERQECDGIW
ncbi:hypothetical protein NPIL_354981 [Nephila pilipes]|uniref:Uncharacterized protein n=1 Tax=Nephila pilipes TaxID=299642 RepID=A0A8X6PND2_NEPPI|nr:hypothetical protein NPIL_354981 [Nephila pilipes]